MKIMLTGGGSVGPVMPLLAVAQEIRKLKSQTEFLFVGTRSGPEKDLVEPLSIPFKAIVSAKLHRYFTLRNLASPIFFFLGFIQALSLVKKFRPDIIVTAGGFVGVPVCWAGKLLGSKIFMHQQDILIGLANRLVSPFATQITTVFEPTAKKFYSGTGLSAKALKSRAEWVGNPVRHELMTSTVDAKKYFNLHDSLPILLILTGGTGAVQINILVAKAIAELVKSYQVVHQTGKGKNTLKFQHENYHPYELIEFEPYAAILRLADFVVSRAGIGTISELSLLGKASVVIPMPKTHQEDNAVLLVYTKSAAVLFGPGASAENLLKVLNRMKFDPETTKMFSENMKKLMPHDSAEKIAKLIIQHVG